MLGAFVRAFRTPDLRKKILFTLGIMALFRLGSFIPTPGVDYTAVKFCAGVVQQGANSGVYNLVNLFSGGALLQLAIFALGIMPYITASIIVQLLTVVIPRFETLKKEGQSGTAKLTQYTRYLTIGLAILQAAGFVTMARQTGALFQGCERPLVYDPGSVWVAIMMILTMTAGTSVVMWLGELVTDRGIGNGMSLLIFTSIAAGFPGALWQLKVQNGWDSFLIVLAVALVIVALVVFVEQAQRRIPVQYAKRMVGRRMYGGSATYIPIKVNQAGVIPVIFASSLLYLPALVSRFAQRGSDPAAPTEGQSTWVRLIDTYFATGTHPVYAIVFFVLIVFFTYFYVAITFNPREIADNMKKHGGFIPGIRAGRPTAEYLEYVLSRITLPGSLYLGLVAIVPIVALGITGTNNVNLPLGGTSVLIVVGVGLETVKQIEAQLQQRNYEGFLR